MSCIYILIANLADWRGTGSPQHRKATHPTWSGVVQHPLKQALVAEAWSSFSEGFRRNQNDEVQNLIPTLISRRDGVLQIEVETSSNTELWSSNLVQHSSIAQEAEHGETTNGPTSFQKSFSNSSIASDLKHTFSLQPPRDFTASEPHSRIWAIPPVQTNL
jgi:hypothetical protein